MRYSPALDGLRAIAVFVVVGFHAWRQGVPGGFLGVDVFFVLSGYLITTILLAEYREQGKLDYAGFLARRCRRLMPGLGLMLVALLAVGPSLFPGRPMLPELLTGLYLTDYSFPLLRMPVLTQHGWSLAVEMQFYLLWPFAILLLARTSTATALRVLACVWIVGTVWRFAAFETLGWRHAYYTLDCRTTGLVAGAMLAMVPRQRLRLAPQLATLALALIGGAALVAHFYDATAALLFGPLAEICALVIVAGVVTGQAGAVGRLLGAPQLVTLGRWSYGIYLWHYPIARIAREAWPGYPAALVTAVVATVLAALSFELVERRFLNRSRVTPPEAENRITPG